MLVLMVATMGVGFAIGFAPGASPPVTAQRPMPTQSPADVEAALRRHGTRHSLAAVDAPDGAPVKTVLHVTNFGWKPTDILVVELSGSGATACPGEFQPSRVKGVTCRGGVTRLASVEIPLGAGSQSALVYSLDPAKVPDACASFQAVRSGRTAPAAWEQTVWAQGLGEPIAVQAIAEADSGVTAHDGQTSLYVNRPAGGAVRDPRITKALPMVWADARSSRVRVMNAAAQCLDTEIGIGGDAMREPCPARRSQRASVPAFDTADLSLEFGSAEVGTLTMAPPNQLPQAQLDVNAVVERLDDSGWVSFGGVNHTAAGNDGGLAFPLAVSALPNQRSELWVTNQHVTATAEINLLMFDGNQQVHRNYNDPVPLCPGGTRRYDILALAGDIPATRPGRGGGQEGAPLLALRVQGSNAALPTFLPLAGVMVLSSDVGVTAYSGLGLAQDIAGALRGRLGGVDNAYRTAAVIPFAKKTVGDKRMTTAFGVMMVAGIQGENVFTVDVYDAAGRPVVQGFARQMGSSTGGFFDMRDVVVRRDGNMPARLPDGFVGTVVIHGQQNRGMVGVVAIDRPVDAARPGMPLAGQDAPAQTTRRDELYSRSGNLLIQWPDPSAPTPTNAPTLRPSPTATATGEITPTPPMNTPARPTPTTSDRVWRKLWLPGVWNGEG